MKYQEGPLDLVIPVLSTDSGWMDNKLLIIQQVFTNYLATYADQSNIYRKDLRSLIRALMDSNLKDDLSKLKDTINTDLIHLYSKYFSPDDITVDIQILGTDVTANEVEITINVKINDRVSGEKYDLSQIIRAERGGKVILIPHIKNNIINNSNL